MHNRMFKRASGAFIDADSFDNSPAALKRGARHEIKLFVKNNQLPTKIQSIGELGSDSFPL